MKVKSKGTFRLSQESPWIKDCTLSKEIASDLTLFSLAKGTDISAESYPHPSFYFALKNSVQIDSLILNEGQCIQMKANEVFGICALEDCSYLEIKLKEKPMNLDSKQIFALKDVLPYQDGAIINKDLVSNEKMKFVVMAFDAGCALSEHAAPAEALVFALDGEGIITYEGKEYPIKAGENFKFDKNGMHAVKATTPFKMALLLAFE